MRPNFALGPIDSVAQYLLYLSIVVLGVLLPLLAQKWRTRREQARLLERTVASLADEMSANRRRMQTSRKSFEALAALLERERDHYLALRERLLASPGSVGQPPAESDVDLNLALTTRTAWDVARLAGALPLLPPARLTACTRAYQMQELFERDRELLLRAAIRSELRSLPADLGQLATLDERLRALSETLSVLRYHLGLADGLIEAYDAALRPDVGATTGRATIPTP